MDREIKYRAYIKKSKKTVEVKSIHFGTRKVKRSYSNSKSKRQDKKRRITTGNSWWKK